MTDGCLLNTSAGHLARPPSSFGHMALTTYAGRWRRRREVSTSTSVGIVVETLALPLLGSLHGAQTKKENKDTAKHRNTKPHIIRNNKRKRSRDKEKMEENTEVDQGGTNATA